MSRSNLTPAHFETFSSSDNDESSPETPPSSDVGASRRPDSGHVVKNTLAMFPGLKTFLLVHTNLRPERLMDVPMFAGLRSLNISENPMMRQALPLIFSVFPNLRIIQLNDLNLTKHDFQNVPRLDQVLELAVRSNPGLSSAIERLFECFPQLTHLTFTESGLGHPVPLC